MKAALERPFLLIRAALLAGALVAWLGCRRTIVARASSGECSVEIRL